MLHLTFDAAGTFLLLSHIRFSPYRVQEKFMFIREGTPPDCIKNEFKNVSRGRENRGQKQKKRRCHLYQEMKIYGSKAFTTEIDATFSFLFQQWSEHDYESTFSILSLLHDA